MIIAGTGHRNQKLGGFELPNPIYIKICKEIEKNLLELKPEKIITGMALGYDQWLANIARKLKIPFVAAIPFVNQEAKWPDSSKRTYNLLLKYASEKVIVSPGEYSASKLQRRNEWMVDHCDLLLACWDLSNGGTANCVHYAQSINKPIIIIDPKL